LSRSFKREVHLPPEELLAQVAAGADRRILSLLHSAWRQRAAAVGGVPIAEALAAGTLRLVVVAEDARAAAEISAVLEAGRRGLALHWGDKVRLGQAAGRADLGAIGITDEGIASRVSRFIGISRLRTPIPDSMSVGEESTREVR